MDALGRDILAFWFGPAPHAAREAWFRKDDAFDATIRARFGDAVDNAIGGAYEAWGATPHGALARIVLLDQFTRNIHRGTPRAFAGDALALACANALVEAGDDRALDPFERWFAYLPFEHTETLGTQERSLALFGALARETGVGDPLAWAEKHAVVVRRFGRFPHRNAILGRPSTPEEIAFLREPGSSF
ncbi:MAG: DUF924 family protein [Betaproteobacteria bacterium]